MPPTTPDAVLLQYGALGVMVLCAGVAIRVLYARLVSAYERERDRADRLEAELGRLNETVRTEYIGTISRAAQATTEATRAVADALAAVRRGG